MMDSAVSWFSAAGDFEGAIYGCHGEKLVGEPILRVLGQTGDGGGELLWQR